jgi:hypothetical protein
MKNSSVITAITTITRKQDIPPSRVAQKRRRPSSVRASIARNSEWGHHRKSGDNGDSGDEKGGSDERRVARGEGR